MVPAPLERDWMSRETGGHAYHCLPLGIANQSGWFLLGIYDFNAVWDGGNKQSAVKISFLNNEEPDHVYVKSHFGSGIITFVIPYLFRTPKGYNLKVSGPANFIRSGIQALEGIVETDWSVVTFTFSWKITIPNHIIKFRKDEPICAITPPKRGELEQFEPEISPIRNHNDIQVEYAKFQRKRHFNNFVNGLIRKKNKNREKKTYIGVAYDHDYFKGTLIQSNDKHESHQKRLKLKKFKRKE